MEVIKNSFVLEVYPEQDLEEDKIVLPSKLKNFFGKEDVLVKPLNPYNKGLLTFILCKPKYSPQNFAKLNETYFVKTVKEVEECEDLEAYYKQSICGEIDFEKYLKVAHEMKIDLSKILSPVLGLIELERGYRVDRINVTFEEGEKISVRPNLKAKEWREFVKIFRQRIVE